MTPDWFTHYEVFLTKSKPESHSTSRSNYRILFKQLIGSLFKQTYVYKAIREIRQQSEWKSKKDMQVQMAQGNLWMGLLSKETCISTSFMNYANVFVEICLVTFNLPWCDQFFLKMDQK